MKRALMFATVASMIDLFNMDNIRILQNLGYKVDVAANFEDGNVTSDKRIKEFKNELTEMGVDYFHIPVPRSITDVRLLKQSYLLTKKLSKEFEYDLLHCHTPIGATISRLAFKNSNTRIIYTAHGFHFYKGSSLKNWLLFYPIEKILSNYTDTLITINREDYNISKKLNSKRSIYVPGVGVELVDLKKNIDSTNLKKTLKINNNNTTVLFSVGELNKNKNHQAIIKALAKLNNESVHYVIAGKGTLDVYLEKLARTLNIEKQVHILGYRNDISELLKQVDIFVFPSIREGLSASLMEAMAVGLPVVASKIRGNVDLIEENKGGLLNLPNDIVGFSNSIISLVENKDMRKDFGEYNKEKVINFSIEKVNSIMTEVYNINS